MNAEARLNFSTGPDVELMDDTMVIPVAGPVAEASEYTEDIEDHSRALPIFPLIPDDIEGGYWAHVDMEAVRAHAALNKKPAVQAVEPVRPSQSDQPVKIDKVAVIERTEETFDLVEVPTNYVSSPYVNARGRQRVARRAVIPAQDPVAPVVPESVEPERIPVNIPDSYLTDRMYGLQPEIRELTEQSLSKIMPRLFTDKFVGQLLQTMIAGEAQDLYAEQELTRDDAVSNGIDRFIDTSVSPNMAILNVFEDALCLEVRAHYVQNESVTGRDYETQVLVADGEKVAQAVDAESTPERLGNLILTRQDFSETGESLFLCRDAQRRVYLAGFRPLYVEMSAGTEHNMFEIAALPLMPNSVKPVRQYMIPLR